jgi:hypothetical protein
MPPLDPINERRELAPFPNIPPPADARVSAHAEAPPTGPPGEAGRRALHEIVHAWIPLGIVIVSVLAAVMGWRASLADESAAHHEELSRQNLVQQQQLVVQDNQAVNADVRNFGKFSEYSLLAHSLRQDAGRVPGALRDQMLGEAQSDLGIARYLSKQIAYQSYGFDPTNPSGNASLRADGTYAPGHPYKVSEALDRAENSDTALHGLQPEQLLRTAESEHDRGVNFEGIAALFVSVMVLLTMGALATGPAKLWLASAGTAVAIVGAVLFITVQVA